MDDLGLFILDNKADDLDLLDINFGIVKDYSSISEELKSYFGNDYQQISQQKKKEEDFIRGSYEATSLEIKHKKIRKGSKMSRKLPVEDIKMHQSSLKQSDNKIKKAKRTDYTKNICTYITNNIIDQFLNQQNTYASKILEKISEICKVDVDEMRKFYQLNKKNIRGIVTLRKHILQSDDKVTDDDYAYKYAFSLFFVWYLRHGYMRYLILEGKMDNQQLYIKFKNENLLTLFSQSIISTSETINIQMYDN